MISHPIKCDIHPSISIDVIISITVSNPSVFTYSSVLLVVLGSILEGDRSTRTSLLLGSKEGSGSSSLKGSVTLGLLLKRLRNAVEEEREWEKEENICEYKLGRQYTIRWYCRPEQRRLLRCLYIGRDPILISFISMPHPPLNLCLLDQAQHPSIQEDSNIHAESFNHE
jgi:hypothetical protein